MKQTADMTALKERHLDVMIKLAFDLDDAEETQRLLDEPETELSAEEERLADEILAKAYQKAEERAKAWKRVRRRAAVRRAMPRVALIASCLILVLTIALPIAIASSPVLRSRVMRLLVEVDEEQGKARFEFVEDPDASFDVPEGWLGEYFPSYIPEGFSIWNLEEYVAAIEYRSETNTNEYAQIYFTEVDDGATGYAGTDNTDISYIDLHGKTAQVIDGYMDNGTHVVTITWASDVKWFMLTTYGIDTETTLEIAGSVKKIVK